ncbi:MAG: DUF1853 family protein [Polaribacter sp.]
MDFKTKEIQKRYEGYLATPNLWTGDVVFDLNQFELKPITQKIDILIDEKIRLGKYVERFVSYQLSTIKEIDILGENIQIQKDKRTTGEIDCLITKNQQSIHLEIIYKFYLYDATVGKTEIEHFIGPNRKDALIEKLNKLKEKQLPLLYTKEAKEYLWNTGLDYTKFKQQVLFKAQLFVSISSRKIRLDLINQDCIVGFYMNKEELKEFKTSKFYVPSKKDWLMKPHQKVNWLSYSKILRIVEEKLNTNFSPLLWIKHPKGKMYKCFIIWWS